MQGLAQSQLVLIAGDLNDAPDFPKCAALWQGGFVDVQDHANYPSDRPGTFNTGIERCGSYHLKTWLPFDSVTGKADGASDHPLVWADFAL